MLRLYYRMGRIAQTGLQQGEKRSGWTTERRNTLRLDHKTGRIVQTGLQEGLNGRETRDRYVSALYWSIMTLTSIGYGDIVPQNTYERIVVTVPASTRGAAQRYGVAVRSKRTFGDSDIKFVFGMFKLDLR